MNVRACRIPSPGRRCHRSRPFFWRLPYCSAWQPRPRCPAETTAYAAGQGALNRIEVGIDVRASVRARCGFADSGAPSGSVDQAEFDRLGINRDFAIRLNCTGASRIAVASLKGGLVAAETAPGYAASAPYRVELRMVEATTARWPPPVARQRRSRRLGPASSPGPPAPRTACCSTPHRPRANGSYLRVTAPPYTGTAPLLAGSYSGYAGHYG